MPSTARLLLLHRNWLRICCRRALDCPRFEVLETSGDLQLRRYHTANWVLTNVTGESLLGAQVEAAKVGGCAQQNSQSSHRDILLIAAIKLTFDYSGQISNGCLT
eukprot:jgi/Chrzof1/257/Cz01g08300.t1